MLSRLVRKPRARESASLALAAACALVSARAHAELPAQTLRCAGSCDVLLTPGVYRVLVESTPSVRGGMLNATITDPGAYRFQGVSRSRRGPALLLGAAGISVAAIGAGMLLGAGAFQSNLSARREQFFWGGTALFAAGVSMAPIGFLLYGSSPKLYRLSSVDPSQTGNAESSAALPRRYNEPALAPGAQPPPGSEALDEPRWGLVSAGALVLATSYGIMAGISAGIIADGSSDNARYAQNFIPFVGPLLVGRNSSSDSRLAWTIYGSLPQFAGGALMLIGALAPRTFAVRSQQRLALAPFWLKDSGGLVLTGTL